ncbi:hypothetical protein F53441_10033 [Fusarium austroafricanum]|uniref:Uncharacterized protein n=1 Tax=Fusarium austroafricanum TaxID=2364996 RepID=A0A8H4NUX2_9HYPO|nr:hypothetical protein F53441_10033 [Fusarium austroafricanum]
MAGETQASLAIEPAKPTVRLKGKDQEYGETQEYDIFMSHNREDDLMDEERWLQYPAGKSLQSWTAIKDTSSTTNLSNYNGHSRATGSSVRNSEEKVIWNCELQGNEESKKPVRKPTERHVGFRILARACKATDFTLNNMKDDMGIGATNQLATDSKVRAVFVGISAIDCRPILMVNRYTGDLSEGFQQNIWVSLGQDNTANVFLTDLRVKPRDEHELIWVENMMIPGNLSYVKRGLWGVLEGHEKKRFLQIMKREHLLLQSGLCPAGVAKILPGNGSQERKPAIRRNFHNDKGYYTLHYSLQWPPMALLEFPPDMIEAMQGFLDSCRCDNVPLNIALAAAVIFQDLEEANDHQSEGLLPSITKSTPIKKPSLAAFILYFPHMLRFVETNHLTAFVHPWRFATFHRDRDLVGRFGYEFRIPTCRGPGSISAASLKLWYPEIRSRHPQVSSSFRFNLIPASMPGTSMVFPQDCIHAERPSSDLFALCCLNDVRTLGLPSYHPLDKEKEAHRSVGGPEWMFTKAVQPVAFRLDGVPSVRYWKAEPTKGIQALTGPAKQIGRVFPDMGSDYYDEMSPLVERRFGKVDSYTQNFQLREDLKESERKIIATRAYELNRIADRLGVPSSARWTSHETLCPVWEGMEGHLKSLCKEGNLKRFAMPEPAPPAKRVKPPEPVLDSEVKGKILDMINGLAAMSCDWDVLREHLKSPEPTMKAVQESFSPLRSFITDVEKTLSAENAGNGQGDLDKVIRVALRAEGTFDGEQVNTMNYQSRWDQHHARFAKFGQGTSDAMEAIFRLRDTPDSFRIILPSIQVLKESPMIKEQVEAYKKIDTLLGHNDQ